MTEQVFEYEVSDANGKSIICQIKAADEHEAEERLIKSGWMVGDLKRILIDSSQTHIQSLPKVQIMSDKATVPEYEFLGLIGNLTKNIGLLIFVGGLIFGLICLIYVGIATKPYAEVASKSESNKQITWQLVTIIGATSMCGLALAGYGEFLIAMKDVAQNSYKVLGATQTTMSRHDQRLADQRLADQRWADQRWADGHHHQRRADDDDEDEDGSLKCPSQG